MPDAPLPFLTREREPGEALAPDERVWSIDDRTSKTSSKAILVSERGADHSEYVQEDFLPITAPPGVMKALLECGLQSAFGRNGRLTVRHKLTLSAFDPTEIIRKDIPDFLILRKGVEFRADHLSFQGRRLYGFFVSIRARQEFQIGLDDPHLVAAATGSKIYYDVAGNSLPGVLLNVNGGSAEVEGVDEGTQAIPISDIRVPAARNIVQRYGELTHQTQVVKSALLAAQVANSRLTPNGQKNRRWLADQYEYIGSWLIRASQGGQIRITWPNSKQVLYLNTKPYEAYDGGQT